MLYALERSINLPLELPTPKKINTKYIMEKFTGATLSDKTMSDKIFVK